jgi:hypothetical protein
MKDGSKGGSRKARAKGQISMSCASVFLARQSAILSNDLCDMNGRTNRIMKLNLRDEND